MVPGALHHDFLLTLGHLANVALWGTVGSCLILAYCYLWAHMPSLASLMGAIQIG